MKARINENVRKMLSNDKSLSAKQYKTAYIFDDVQMNFHPESYNYLTSNESWKERLVKNHSQLNEKREMQSSNSSDALLMNIFCHPKFLKWRGVRDLLGANLHDTFTFGWNPKFDNETKLSPTEIDVKFGDTIVEAKLAEESFTEKELSVVKTYTDFPKLFHVGDLMNSDGKVSNYQLIRNIITAYNDDLKFILLLDEQRTDLIRSYFQTCCAIKDRSLLKKLSFLTWQELASFCGRDLKDYIHKKYF